ncbi:MAG: hypothetical protein RL138_1651 [Bacteroidota bacterium]|jgi:Rieske Fe-S protein
MQRKEFLKTCAFACLSLTAVGALLPSCQASHTIIGSLEKGTLSFPLSDFIDAKKNVLKKYLVVQHENLQYPIVVYHQGENAYEAYLMRCPHQGAELQVFGERLQCPAHGSEFDVHGTVMNPPADQNLRRFNLEIIEEKIIIHLQ